MAIAARSPRVRPGFRRFAIVAFIGLTPIALHTAWDHYEARRLARLVADIRSRNEPVSAPIARIAAHSQSDQNAARYYEAAAALVEPGAALYGPTGLLHRMETAPVADRSRLLGELCAWLERNREAETLLARATELPFEGYLPGTDYSFRSHAGIIGRQRSRVRPGCRFGDWRREIPARNRIPARLTESTGSGLPRRGTHRSFLGA